MFELNAKVAVINGSTRGIGKATPSAMSQSGARLVISSCKAATIPNPGPGQTGAPVGRLASDPRRPDDRSDHGSQGTGQGCVRYRIRNAVAVITLDNPPVNALGPGMPRQIVEGLQRAQAEERVRAVVITGKGSGFCAGADIRRLGQPWPAGEPTIRAAIAACEASPKAVVAAIHGVALGGGLELALACHFRLASENARLGQPEVKIGVPPGAGGTQRLPRVVGLEPALAMIVSGEPITAEKALEIGLIEQILEEDLVRGACRFAAAQAESGAACFPRARDRAMVAADPDCLEAVRERISRSARGQRAPHACIECVEAATRLEFEVGLAFERRIFEECVVSSEARALRHAFSAQRAAAKIPGLDGVAPIPIESAAVVGAGTMGTGIAMSLANAGIGVTLADRDRGALETSVRTIRDAYRTSLEKGRLDEAQRRARLALIEPVGDLGEVAGADIVIEAVFEDMELKREMFVSLDRICRPGTILASNTSYLDINELARATGRADKVLGTHFFSPAHVMPLLEVVRGQHTSGETLASAMGLAKRIGKTGVVAGACHGFIGNRMLEGYLGEAAFLLEEGALPEQVDRALFDFGFAMGPFAMSDLAGLDIGWRKRRARGVEPGARYPGHVADRLCELGRLGQKTGAGYYRYEKGSRVPIPDPSVEELIEEVSAARGIERRAVSEREMVERCVLALVSEGARILEEGIARRAGDIDVVWLHGYGFPRWRGGPLFFAGEMGLARVEERIARYRRSDVAWWRPVRLLRDLARRGLTFEAHWAD